MFYGLLLLQFGTGRDPPSFTFFFYLNIVHGEALEFSCEKEGKKGLLSFLY